MASIFSFIAGFIVIICLCFILYSLYTLKRFYGVTIDVRIPQPYRTCYRFFRDTPIVGKEVVQMRSDLSLMYNSDSFARVATAIAYTIFPIAFVSIFLICALVLDIWYFVLIIGLFSCFVLYFTVTNRIIHQAKLLRYNSISIYESAERRLSNGERVVECFQQISEVSSGFVRRVTLNFGSKFSISPDDAYEYLQDCIGDKYSQSFARSLRAYDEEGIDPCSEILNTISLARRHYYIERRTSAKVGQFKKLMIMLLVIAIAMAKVSTSMAYSMGGTSGSSWMTYLSVLMILTCYCMALFYERY